MACFFLCMLVFPSVMSAEYVGSTVKGATVTYLAKAGTIVKKGQIIFKLRDREQKVLIEKQKLQLESALANLKDKQSDLERSNALWRRKSISLAEYENTAVAYHRCQLLSERLRIKIEQSELYHELLYVGKAPYDCKVIRQVACVNSGTDDGTYMLEIQPLDAKNSADTTDKSSPVMKVTANLSGELIAYLPKEGQIVKKGEPMVKLDTSIIRLK